MKSNFLGVFLCPLFFFVSSTVFGQESRPNTHADIDRYCAQLHGIDNNIAVFNCRQEERKNLNQRTLACVQSANTLKIRAEENRSFITKCMGASSDQQLVTNNVQSQLERGSLSYPIAIELFDQKKLSDEQIEQLIQAKVFPAKPCPVTMEQFRKWMAIDDSYNLAHTFSGSKIVNGTGVDLIADHTSTPIQHHSFWSGQCSASGAEGDGNLYIDFLAGNPKPSNQWIHLSGLMRNGRFDGNVRIVSLPAKHPFNEFPNEYAVNRFSNGNPVAVVREKNELKVRCTDHATESFSDNLDGTFSDPKNGLTWLKCPIGTNRAGDFACSGSVSKLNWESALKAAKNSHANGHSDWRFPTSAEVASLGRDNGMHRCKFSGKLLLFGGYRISHWLADQSNQMSRLRVGETESTYGGGQVDPDSSDVGVILVRGQNASEWGNALSSIARWKQGIAIRHQQIAEESRRRQDTSSPEPTSTNGFSNANNKDSGKLLEAQKESHNKQCSALYEVCLARCEGLNKYNGGVFVSDWGKCKGKCQDAKIQCK